MDGMSGLPGWGMWVVMIVGTAAFWAAVFLAVRALYSGRDTAGSPDPAAPWAADRLGERLARGEITVQEYEYLRAESDAVPVRPPSRPPHR